MSLIMLLKIPTYIGIRFTCCRISLLFHVVIDRGLWFVIVQFKFQTQVHTIKQSQTIILIGRLTTITVSRNYNRESKWVTLWELKAFLLY